MSTPDNARRYLDITRAHHTLTTVARAAGYVNYYANELVVLNDEADGEVPVRDALVSLRDAAGAAAIGAAPPLDTNDWARAYAEALTKQLRHLASEAEAVAAGARSVLDALDAGLITAPRTWAADEVTGPAMADYLAETAETGGDAAQMWGCITALRRYRDDETITEVVYDRHMRRIADMWTDSHDAATGRYPGRFPIMAEPKDTAELVQGALESWGRRQDEANNALALPIPYLRAAQLINGCDTFERLTHYAAALTGPAWSESAETTDTYDNARQAADRLMIALGRRFNTKMSTDAAGVNRSDADKLATIIAVWRSGVVDDAVTFANTLDFADYEDSERDQVAEDAYKRLYRAADVAVTTSEMVDIWHAADVLSGEHGSQVRTVLALRFDSDDALPGFGQRITVAGAHREATRELRALVDAHDMPSNATAAMCYRDHAAAIDELNMRGPVSDMQLCRAWAGVVGDADAGHITRRQLAALRDRTNAKVAEYSGGSEHKAASLAARLAEWDRIGDELAA